MKVVGHRGAPQAAPENTMAAFEAARDMGADGVELDVHATRDGQLVVIHDYTVDRTTDGTGLVLDLSAHQISRLDAGSWFSDAFAGEPVPRLSEVLALDAVQFEVQLCGFGPGFMMATAAAADEARALDRTEFTSWDAPGLMALKERLPAARIGLFSRRREAWMPDALFERSILDASEVVPADVVHVHARDITVTIAERLHDLGREVYANDAATAADVRRAIACGADRLSTDDPETAVAVRASMRPAVEPSATTATPPPAATKRH